MTEDNKEEYFVLLKCMRDLKKKVDELVNKNYEGTAVLEITHLRNCVEQIIQKYLSDTNRDNNNISKCVQNSNGVEHSTKSRVKYAMKELIDISSSFRTQIDVLKCNQIDDNRECGRITNLNDINKKHFDKHEKCGKQLKLYEQYIIELECRLKEFLNFVFIDNRSDHRQIVKEIRLQTSILKLKRNESHYKNKVIRLSQELGSARRRLEESQNHTDELVLKIQQLKRVAEKNATSSANLAKSLSSVAVELSFSCCDRRPTVTRDDLDRREDNACVPSEMNVALSSAAASCQPEDGSQTFPRSTSHSNPNWNRTRDQRTDVSNDRPNDCPSIHCDDSMVGPPSKLSLICKVCRNGIAETDRSRPSSSQNEKIEATTDLCDIASREMICCICQNCDAEEPNNKCQTIK